MDLPSPYNWGTPAFNEYVTDLEPHPLHNFITNATGLVFLWPLVGKLQKLKQLCLYKSIVKLLALLEATFSPCDHDRTL